MPEYCLYYFPLRCRAEPARLILAYAGAKYDDKRIAFDEWPALKPKMPMGQMPVLEVDGKMLCQSTAIGRYLAREFGLAGKTNLDAAKADMLVDGVFDMWGNIRPVYMCILQKGSPINCVTLARKLASLDEGKKKEAWDKFKADHLNSFLDRYAKFVAESGSGWLVGESVTWADLTVGEFLSVLEDCFSPDALEKHPDLKAYVAKVQDLPQVAQYIKGRPPVPF